MDQRPDDHDRPGALSRELPCGHCGHPAHPYEWCDRCTCQHS